jgi:site-specific recombinase XerD
MQYKADVTIEDTLPGFVDYMKAERNFSAATATKYHDNVRWFLRDIGNLSISDIGLEHFISLKARMTARGAREARVASVVCAMKALITYARDVLRMATLDLTKVKAPRSPRRRVIYLSNEELNRFLAAVPLRNWAGKPRVAGYRFRAIVETLAATGMRISEVLSLDRDSINIERRQATVVGKGNRERIVFFTDHALEWINRYLDLRPDTCPALFATRAGMRITKNAVEAMFRRNARWAGMDKPVTPHIIRHTTATNLLRNGCPLGFIKEILGHERLETTCRFYLGVLNQADTQNAHRRYLNFESSEIPVKGAQVFTPKAVHKSDISHGPL